MNADPSLSPTGLRVADMNRSGEGQTEAIPRGPGIWESRGVGNCYLLTTPEGDVLINTGTLKDGKRAKDIFAKISQNPIRYIVLTQSHGNQYGGLEVFKTPDNVVIAHRNYPEERAYNELLAEHYMRGSRRIFHKIVGPSEDLMPTRDVPPDLLIGDEGYSFELGGRRFEIVWTPGGETRSAVIVWLPQERIAIVGNLFGPLFGNQPNLNTLRGDKPRWALQFIDSVRKLRALAPERLLTGHEVIEGAEHIEREVTRIIDAVQWVHDRTVEGMNQGLGVQELMATVKPPPELQLTEEYGKVAWNVRAIWHEYTGWFDYARGTTDLYHVPASSVAPAIAELAGGADRLAERARGFVAEGKPLEALHMLDVALAADPASALGREVKREALKLLNEHTGGKNLWERMWIASEIAKLDA
jgi:alkyl sulfatase BDS1-like metallo-beta-lactamase superfamily hydrolase